MRSNHKPRVASISASAAQTPHRGARPWPAILWGGCIAGALDITYAIVSGMTRGGTPARTLKSVASGVLGRGAFQGGWETAALGLFLHFGIAVGAATTYFVASRKLAVLREHAWMSGLLFGALVYLFMNKVLVPLSDAPFTLSLQIPGLLVHMFGVGLPIALCVRRFGK